MICSSNLRSNRDLPAVIRTGHGGGGGGGRVWYYLVCRLYIGYFGYFIAWGNTASGCSYQCVLGMKPTWLSM